VTGIEYSRRVVDGLLFIGDPHLEARIPGFRKDDYPAVAIEKLRWCLKYAQQNRLQPILLGDLFHLPQDNPNWLISRIIDILSTALGEPLPAIYGNHDVRENTRKPNDSISILFAGGHLRLVSQDEPWVGIVGGKKVFVGGTVWGEKLPKSFDVQQHGEPDLVAWITHHDILIPGYEEGGRIRPSHIPGIDVVVNGHIHRRLEPLAKDQTSWVTAGNITRRSRSDAARQNLPAVACLVPPGNVMIEPEPSIESFDFDSHRGDSWQMRWVRVPHEPFDEVFHAEMQGDELTDEEDIGSSFIADLAELTSRKTETGAGLMQFLDQNLGQFEKPVADEIRRLAAEVTNATPVD
jgi:DNA repair exonuclease SbcCD nuclease subunit